VKPTALSRRFGREMAAVRADLGISQTQLARMLRITSNHVSLMENGHRTPSYRLLRTIFRKLGPTIGSRLLLPGPNHKEAA
jgi:transcriptional regulator with XRE-family HTH domain